MSYLDRLRSCRYRSPSGAEFELAFTEVMRSGAKKAAVHEFPQADTPEIQDLGNQGQRFPLRAEFSGQNYDLTADAFVQALSEAGAGTLLHPRWGDIRAVPLTWKQSETFVDGMGRAEFEVEFARTDETLFPISEKAIELQMADSLDAISESASGGFAAYDPENAMDAAASKAVLTDGLTRFRTQMQAIVAQNAEVATEFDRVFASVVDGFDTVILDPSAAAASVISLMRLPATVESGITAKINGYSAVVDSLAASFDLSSGAQAMMAVLQLLGLGLGLADSATVGSLADREDAADAAGATQDATTALVEAVEAVEAAVSGYMTDAAIMAALRAALAQAAALLLEKAFSLRAARRVTLTRDSTPLDLVYELLAPESAEEMETALDEFIAQNRLAGDMILMVPAGTEVAYYAG